MPMSGITQMCRLCKDKCFLQNMLDGSSKLALQIQYCIGLEIKPEEELPKMICKQCAKKIKKFFKFKSTCLKVDEELRIQFSTDLDHFYNSFTLDPMKVTAVEETQKIEIEVLNGTARNSVSEEQINEFLFARNTNNGKKTQHEYENNDETNYDSGENNISNITKSSLVQLETRNVVKEHVIQCELCGSIFQKKTEFRNHVSLHNAAKLYQCKLCPKQFTRAETKQIHMRSHFGLKPYMCDICGQSSTKRQDLIRHMKIHSNERNYKCMLCGRSFKRSGDLSSHERTHTGVRPYKCYLCEKNYTSHSGLRKHYKIHLKKEIDL